MDYIKGLFKHYNLVPGDGDDYLFEQRETLVTHSRFQDEIAWMSMILAGDAEGMKNHLNSRSADEINIGKLSNDPLMQSKYCAVAFMSIGCRIAMMGGAIESDAYNYSDAFIRSVDNMKTDEEVYNSLIEATFTLVEMVKAAKARTEYPLIVRECINYISDHLHYKLTLSELADFCKVSPSYLSAVFKKATGQNLSKYIVYEKL